MQVRNKQYKVSDHLGSWTDASDEECPCRSCFHPHDFGFNLISGYKVLMLCMTRERGGCPDIIPEPEHVYTKNGKVCKRCGHNKK